MDEKKENCKRCGKKIEPKTKRAEFCSPKCKVYWHRENRAVKVQDLTKPKTITLKPPPQTNFTIDTAEKIRLLEEELKTVPDIGLGKKRRAFIQNQISKLKP